MKSIKQLNILLCLFLGMFNSPLQALSQQNLFSVVPTNENGLLRYDATTFASDIVKSAKPVVVLISTTWCPPCQQLKPVFYTVAELLRDSYEFVLLDGDINFDIVQQLQVRSYPTLFVYKNGQQFNLSQHRTKNSLKKALEEL